MTRATLHPRAPPKSLRHLCSSRLPLCARACCRPAAGLLPLTMVLSAGCGGVAAMYQWVLESRLHQSDPKRFKPGPIEGVKEVRRRLKEGEQLPSAVKGAVQACSGRAPSATSGCSSMYNEKSGGTGKAAVDSQWKKSRVGVEPQAETALEA